MANQPKQEITPLSEADHKRLHDQRGVVEEYLADENSRQKYKMAAGKLGIIHGILESDLFKPNQTYELQCLGSVLGDAFVQKLNMEWIMVEDEYGRDPAVRLPGTDITLFPLTMISKRAERGEKVHVFDLFNNLPAGVDELRRPSH
jgi:hypothetical protein